MRKMVFGRKLSRGKKGRQALLRSLVRAIVVDGKITTTKAKAKAIVGEVDKLITLAKKGNLSARRSVLAFLGNDRATTDKVFSNLVPSFSQRNSGYTRLVLLPSRRGDNAEMARLEWVDEVKVKEVKKEEKPKVKKEAKKTVKKEVKKVGKKVSKK